jgi:hypothetical protein
MVESAALLVDEVLPAVPMRQWVLSVPFALRFLFASNSAAMGLQGHSITYRIALGNAQGAQGVHVCSTKLYLRGCFHGTGSINRWRIRAHESRDHVGRSDIHGDCDRDGSVGSTLEASSKSMRQYFSRDLAHGGCCWVAFCHRKDAGIFLHFLRLR